MNIVKISKTNDPFKKYWWVILVAFGAVGGFICLPGGDTSPTVSGAGGERGFKSTGEQSLDAVNNPNGAPGGAIDLSMEGSGPYKKSDGPITSSLYQAPADETASSSATATAKSSSGNLAGALKMVASKHASASADSSGWGGEKAQKGFTAPKASFGAMSGVGGGGGGGGGASFSAGGGEGSVSAFGNGKANTGVSFARGLGSGASEDEKMKNATASMRSLNTAANGAISASGQKSNDLAAAMGGRSFDGSSFTGGGSGSGVGGGGGGGVALGGAGTYAKLDAAPKNLKANPTNLDQKTIAPPAAKPPPPPPQKSMQDMIMQMVVTGLIGAVMQGLVGALF